MAGLHAFRPDAEDTEVSVRDLTGAHKDVLDFQLYHGDPPSGGHAVERSA